MGRSKVPSNKDKVELSPNGRARCRQCRTKILKGSKRFGIETYSPRYDNYTVMYYHESCLPSNRKSHLRLQGGRSPEDELSCQHKQQVEAQTRIRERRELRESLRQLRLSFARRLSVPAYRVFHDTVLDALTVRMPQTKTEFLAVPGLAEKKYQSFGAPVLQVIQHYHRLYNQRQQNRHSSSSSPPSHPRPPTKQKPWSSPSVAAPVRQSKGDEEVVEAMETLSCEDIVSQKFAHARANGYVVEI